MLVYVMNSRWQRTQIINSFESMIWTERWAGYGDFELVVSSTPDTRKTFVPGTRLGMDLSHRVMLVETVEGKYGDTDDLTIKGRSIEAIMESRVARNSLSNLKTQPKWILEDEPLNIAETMFEQVCMIGAIHPDDQIPYLFKGSFFPEDTISQIQDGPVKWEQELATLYDAMVSVCTQYELGFRIVREDSSNNLFFKVYTGSDRTTTQRRTNLPPVVFARELDNFDNISELSTNEGSRNIAYVFSTQGAAIVYSRDVGAGEVYGLDRRVLFVNADEVPNVDYPTADNISQYLERVGKTELAKRRPKNLFDGEVTRVNTYEYQKDYWLGDIVEIRSSDGELGYRRVSEQIFVCDAEGERMYPTLSSTTIYDIAG